MAVRYDSVRFPGEAGYPSLTTAVRCEMNRSGRWHCLEQPIEQTARTAGIPLARTETGFYTQESLEAVLRAIVAR